MSQIDDAIKDHRKECAEESEKKYVTWSQYSKWFVGICIGVVSISCTIAFATGRSIQQGKDIAERAIEMAAKTDSAFIAHVIDDRAMGKQILSELQQVKEILQR